MVVKKAEWWLGPTTPDQYGQNPDRNTPKLVCISLLVIGMAFLSLILTVEFIPIT